jgi:hypothetical protein
MVFFRKFDSDYAFSMGYGHRVFEEPSKNEDRGMWCSEQRCLVYPSVEVMPNHAPLLLLAKGRCLPSPNGRCLSST